jgi:hypothetical protein
MRVKYEKLLAGFARRQHGVVPRSQLLDAHVRPEQIKYMLRSGRLERVFEAVYRVAGVPESWDQRLLAACWAGGVRGSMVSHRAACGLWELPAPNRYWRSVGLAGGAHATQD